MRVVRVPEWFTWSIAFAQHDTARHLSATRAPGRDELYVCNVEGVTLNDAALEVHDGKLLVRVTSTSLMTYNPRRQGFGTFRSMGCEGGFCVTHVLIGRDKPIIGEMWVYPMPGGGYLLHFTANEGDSLKYEITEDYELLSVRTAE
jgi:hypothetical protein